MVRNPTPRYYQIYRLLRQAIENREFDENAPMPGEHALRETYGVSRLTIRRSLALLEAEGLVDRRQGSGTYPCLDKVKVEPIAADINALMAHMDRLGSTTRAELLSFSYERPGDEVRSRLELTQSAQVQKAIRVRYHADKPFSHLVTYVPETIGRRYAETDLATQPLQQIFAGLGIRLGSAEQFITAMLADAHHAQALQLEPGAALLCIRRVTRCTQGIPVEYLIATYNPRRFEYGMMLTDKELAHAPG